MRASGVAVAVPDLDAEVRAFAERQVFSCIDEKIRYDPDQPARNLEHVKKALYESDINVGSQSFCWCGLRIWLGDPVNGIRASASIRPEEDAWKSDSALANWLHRAALREYPDSAYARQATHS